MKICDLTIKIGILASGIAPRYIDDHAILLHLSPDGFVVKHCIGTAKSASKIFARDWPELNPGRDISRDGHLIGVNDGIR